MSRLSPLLVALALALAAQSSDPAPQKASPIDQETLLGILDIRRVYVDRLAGGDTAVR